MGRNGKKMPIFGQMVQFINLHVGETVTAKEILLGDVPSRRAATSYLYKFKLMSFIEQTKGTTVMDPEAEYFISQAIPNGFTSEEMKQRMKILRLS